MISIDWEEWRRFTKVIIAYILVWTFVTAPLILFVIWFVEWFGCVLGC